MNAHFLQRLRSEDLDGARLRLLEPLQFYSEALDRTFTVEAGFECDAYSAPRDLLGSWAIRGLDRRPAVLHDKLYDASSDVTREQADDLLLEAMLAVGIEEWRARSFHDAVRLAGECHFHTKGQPA